MFFSITIECNINFTSSLGKISFTLLNAQNEPTCQKRGIIHRFWATCRKLLDKNRLDFKASRLRIRQSNRKREIESRFHLSR